MSTLNLMKLEPTLQRGLSTGGLEFLEERREILLDVKEFTCSLLITRSDDLLCYRMRNTIPAPSRRLFCRLPAAFGRWVYR